MRLVCPNCAAKYEVDDTAIPDEGRDVQCSVCGNTWFQGHEAPGFVAPEDDSDDVQKDIDDVPDDDPAPGTLDHVRPPIDPRISKVLSDERERENNIRNGEKPDFDVPRFSNEIPSEQDDSQFQEPAQEEAPELEPSPRREAPSAAEIFPDVDELNSSLRPAGVPRNPKNSKQSSETAPNRNVSARFGFYLAIFLALVLIAAYSLSAQISVAVPAAAPFLASFTVFVDQVRHGLAGAFSFLIKTVHNLLAQFL